MPQAGQFWRGICIRVGGIERPGFQPNYERNTHMAKKSLVSRLDEVIEYIDELGIPSVIEAIERDHLDLRKFIGVLKSDSKRPATKKAAYKQFAELLKSHSVSEEKAVYAKCLRIGALKQDAYEGYV